MNVLVVGGAGYIGSHVSRSLLDDGHNVTVFDNLSSGCKENLFPDARFVQGDILDYPALAEVMSGGFDGLIHLAAFKAAGESMILPQKYSLNNICGTLNLLNAATQNEVKNFVFSSSAAVYGEPKYIPMDESHPQDPQNYYGFTKLEIEKFLHWYDRLKSIRFAALRYFNAAGYDTSGRICGLERNPANLLPTIMEVATGKRPEISIFGNDYNTPDGTGIRDYIHVSDLARAHILALEHIMKVDKSTTLNLGSEKGISVLEMIEKSRKITGRSIPVKVVERRVGDCAVVVASSNKAREVLGWKALYSDTETLIESTWNIYKQHII